jgi:hypothetical protein
MAKLTNMFIKGKMNLDLDERLIPKGEYRKAQNILITNSEDSDVGAIENVKGHEVVNAGSLNLGNGVEDNGVVIGSYADTAKQRIFWFITNFTSNDTSSDINTMERANSADDENCRIVMRESNGSLYYLASGDFLNFSTTHQITGVNVIGDYLYWTDNYNQPRYIDIELAKSDASYYDCEEKISVAKVAPFLPPFLHNSNEAGSNANLGDTYTLVTTDPTNNTQHTKSEYMQEKFIRFAYRYKYQDNTYSIISPFTQHVFKPLNSGNIEFGAAGKSDSPEPIVSASSQYMYTHNEAPLMKNAYDKVVMRIPIPTVTNNGVITEHETASNQVSTNSYINELKIDSIEILLREAGTSSIQIVDTIDMVNTTGLVFERYKVKPKSSGYYHRQTVKYTYLARDPFKVLPEKQLIRVGDNAPVRAKSQEVVGSRLVYGNITLGYDLPRDEDNKKGIKFIVTSGPKGENEVNYDVDDIGHYFHNREQYKYHNIKQRRTYQVGMVLVDRYGRTSPVIPSTYKVDNLSDTHTVDAQVATDLYNKFNSAYSWSGQHAAYGQALSIEFKDSRIVEESKTHKAKRPNGWYAWRLVVKQKEQDYYNVYTQHPMVNWSSSDATTSFGDNSSLPMSGYRDQHIKGRFTTGADSRSWFSLTNDNINKVPRSIKSFNNDGKDFGLDRDGFGRLVTNTNEGLSGSEVKLYPKVVQINTAISGNHYDSRINPSIDQDYINVLSIGSATDQGLSSLSNAKRDDGQNNTDSVQDSTFEDRPRPYSFLADNHKNPLVVEIPNLYNEPVNVEGEFLVSTIGTGTTGTTAGTNVNINDAIRTQNNNFANMPFGYPNSKDKGLTVFETKPFESELDIYYETSTCGLVRDLNEHCDYAANGPTNIQITPTFEVNSFTPATSCNMPEEAMQGAQIGEITATPYDPNNQGITISSYTILACANSTNDGNDLAKFAITYQNDKSYVRISTVKSSSTLANQQSLLDGASGMSEIRLSYQYIKELTAGTTGGSGFPTNFNGNGWYRIVFWEAGTGVNNNVFSKKVVVVNIDDTGGTNKIQSFMSGADQTTNIPANIKQNHMLVTSDVFAFYNNTSNDRFNFTIRATQSNGVTGNGNLIVNVSNSMPIANNPGGAIIPSTTVAGDRYLETLVGYNGSADTNNRSFGMTATLSGNDASMFTAAANQNNPGTWNLNTTPSFNFTSIFGLPVNGNYSGSLSLSWNVTDNGGLSPTIAQTISLTPVQVKSITAYHNANETTACNNAQTQANTTYYAIKHNGANMPMTAELFVGNKIYTNNKITTNLGAGYIVLENANGSFIPYAINSSGVITSVGSTCPTV